SGDSRPRRGRKAGKVLVDSLALMFWAFLLSLIRILAACLPAEPRRHPRIREVHCTHHRATMSLLTRMLLWIERTIETEMDEDDELRRLFIVLDLAATVVVGLLRDHVLFDLDGLESLDDYDFREWLENHGARPETRES